MMEDFTKFVTGSTLRVKISDGRVIEGEFACLDRDLNIILNKAIEFFSMDAMENGNEETSKTLGQAMVPGAHIIDIFMREETS